MIKIDYVFSKKDTVGDLHAVVAFWEATFKGFVGALQNAVELLEIGEGGLPHPHYEVLVDEAIVDGVLRLQFVHGPGPIGRRRRACRVHTLVSHHCVQLQKKKNTLEDFSQAEVAHLRVAVLNVFVRVPADAFAP